MGTLTAKTASDTDGTDALDPGSCNRKSSGFSCFLKFGIAGDTADWVRAESSGIPPVGCTFWKCGAQGFSDFGAYLRKTKNLAAGVKFTAGD